MKAYDADGLCTFRFTAATYREMLATLNHVSTKAWAQAIDKDLPVLLIAGDCDPVGNYGSGVRKVWAMLGDAGVNPNTMQRALQELESRGLLQAQRTAGRTVTADDTALQALRRRRAGTLAAEFLHQMQALGLTEAEIETLLRETAQQAPKKE